MATLRDNATGSSSTRDMPDGTINYEGQTFTPTEEYVCEQIRFYGTWGHGDPGTCRVSIQETTAGLPDGNLLTDWAEFSVAGAQAKTLRTVNFDTTPTLSIGTKYAIVWDAPSGIPNTQELIIWGHGSSTYAGGNRVYHTGSWVDSPSTEQYFQIWGSDLPAPTKPTNPTPVDTGTDIDFSDLTLSWEDGGGADTYDVYVGDAADNLTLISSTQSDVSIVLDDTQRALFTDTCYWRIDATNVYGTTTGDDWWFAVAAPGKAQNPTPTDDEEDIEITGIDQLKNLQWEAPA